MREREKERKKERKRERERERERELYLSQTCFSSCTAYKHPLMRWKISWVTHGHVLRYSPCHQCQLHDDSSLVIGEGSSDPGLGWEIGSVCEAFLRLPLQLRESSTHEHATKVAIDFKF